VFVLTRNQKGTIAELEVAAAATKLGIGVYRPVSEHSRADLIFDLAGELLRVQCKWGRLSRNADVVIIRVGGSWCSPSGYVTTKYSEGEIDLFAIYCGELDRAFLVPAELGIERKELWLRLRPTRNSQQACINLADQYDFNGAVAQLEERRAGARASARRALGSQRRQDRGAGARRQPAGGGRLDALKRRAPAARRADDPLADGGRDRPGRRGRQPLAGT
jgi:PD-(D/E)XK endonuclease